MVTPEVVGLIGIVRHPDGRMSGNVDAGHGSRGQARALLDS